MKDYVNEVYSLPKMGVRVIANVRFYNDSKGFNNVMTLLTFCSRDINLGKHLTTFTSKPSFFCKIDMEKTFVEDKSCYM